MGLPSLGAASAERQRRTACVSCGQRPPRPAGRAPTRPPRLSVPAVLPVLRGCSPSPKPTPLPSEPPWMAAASWRLRWSCGGASRRSPTTPRRWSARASSPDGGRCRRRLTALPRRRGCGDHAGQLGSTPQARGLAKAETPARRPAAETGPPRLPSDCQQKLFLTNLCLARARRHKVGCIDLHCRSSQPER